MSIISSFGVTDNIKNIAQLKSKLGTVIQNIRELELFAHLECDDNTRKILSSETAALLANLENSAQQQRLVRAIKKRNNKRRRHKKKIKMKTSAEEKCVDKEQKETNKAIAQAETAAHTNDNIRPTVPRQPRPNEFQQLKNYHNAQRYLQTFELLEILQYARSQEKSSTYLFRENFVKLRAIWNSILLENTPKRTEARRNEDQWNEVLFGASEQIYYSTGGSGTSERLRDLVRIRQTWDSYLVRNKKHGSSIPTGWVLPRQNIQESWVQFKTQ